jgi:hypothetical protein
MTAAAAWEAAGDALPPEIARMLDSSGEPLLVGQKLLLVIPEWQVALRGGTTNSSTDVLAICRNDLGLCILGVEAKVLEDFGPLGFEQTDWMPLRVKASGWHTFTRFCASSDLTMPFAINSCIALRPRFSQQGSSTLGRLSCWCRHSIRQSAQRADFEAFRVALGAREIAPLTYKVDSFSGPCLYLAWCDGNVDFRDVVLPSAPQFTSEKSSSML